MLLWAQKWFSDQLETESGKAIGKAYFSSRGFRDEIKRSSRWVTVPEGWDVLTKAAVAAGYGEERLEESGLCKRNRTANYLTSSTEG